MRNAPGTDNRGGKCPKLCHERLNTRTGGPFKKRRAKKKKNRGGRVTPPRGGNSTTGCSQGHRGAVPTGDKQGVPKTEGYGT